MLTESTRCDAKVKMDRVLSEVDRNRAFMSCPLCDHCIGSFGGFCERKGFGGSIKSGFSIGNGYVG